VVDLGWQHLSNGELLAAGEAEGYEVLITKDANMPQNGPVQQTDRQLQFPLRERSER
jgi:hypothetical protein